MGFLGLWGKKVDSIEYYEQKLQDVNARMSLERGEMTNDESAVLPVGFVSFNSQWGAAVAAQTQQDENPTKWLTTWAPEPNDIYWRNLEIIQSLAYMEHLEEVSPFNLKPIVQRKILKLVIQGFLPGFMLQFFLFILEKLLIFFSRMEGHVAVSEIERQAAAKYYYFMLVNVILGSLVAGTAFEELPSFLRQLPTKILESLGDSLPTKATFFITYVMVDGWAGTASEILQPIPLLIFHLKELLFPGTRRESDREEAMELGSQSIDFTKNLPRICLYFLLGFGYALYNPILLPFVDIFFGFAYVVYRHQIINVYNQRYESVGGFWPHLHTRFVAGLLISQVVLFALFTAYKATYSNMLLLLPPISTFFFHKYCQSRFQPAFTNYSIKGAIKKDEMEQRRRQPNFNLEAFIGDTYLNPIFKSVIEEQPQQQGSAAESSSQNSPSPSPSSHSVIVYDSDHHRPPDSPSPP